MIPSLINRLLNNNHNSNDHQYLLEAYTDDELINKRMCIFNDDVLISIAEMEYHLKTFQAI